MKSQIFLGQFCGIAVNVANFMDLCLDFSFVLDLMVCGQRILVVARFVGLPRNFYL